MEKLRAICVTGAFGYLGGRVVAKLREGGIAVTACPGRRDGLDLTDPVSVADYFGQRDFGTVIHCAAIVPKTPEEYADDRMGAENLRMTENLIAAQVPYIVFSSSMTVYPPGLPIPVVEDAVTEDRSGYAGYKRQAERALCAADNLTTTILRLPGLFGPPRRSGLLHNAAMRFATGQIPDLKKPFPMWAAMHVDDAADLLCRAAGQVPDRSRILNAGYPDPMSVTRTVSRLAEIFGIDMPPCDAPSFQMDLTALAETLGLPEHSLDSRLRELAGSVQISEAQHSA